jgi:hypothetical protein
VISGGELPVTRARLFGYPETAIQAFVRYDEGVRIAWKEQGYVLGKVFTKDEVRLFQLTCPFRLSRAYWREEAFVALEWFEVLRQKAPETYRRLLAIRS